MMHYIQIFYSYILPIMALYSFGYIIFLKLTRQADFELMENNFYNSMKKNNKLSNEAIQIHFDNMQHHTKLALQKLDTDTREQLQEALSSFEDINKAQRSLSYQLQELQRANSELQRANSELHNEIKKRDAIIERKTKQMQRLKDAV